MLRLSLNYIQWGFVTIHDEVGEIEHTKTFQIFKSLSTLGILTCGNFSVIEPIVY